MVRRYADKNDRVKVISVEQINNGFGTTSLREDDLGKTGTVLRNDGFGHCNVLLDDGREVSCWEGRALEVLEAS